MSAGVAAPASVVVLGGGTAGWMAACLMRRAWPACAVTLVESREIGIVGVGEGSTPQLRAFFARLGIAEDEWMPACDATFKLGIRFDGWSDAPGHASYFHPFASEVDLHTEPAFHAAHLARRRGADVDASPGRFFLNARLAAENKAPLPDERFPFQPGYGYHFDAHRLGAFLRDWAVRRGVCHREGTVRHVAVGDGRVTHLVTDGGAIDGEWFVDASGFRAAIASDALNVPFVSYADALFNDAAVTIATPHNGPIANHTRATALRHGWAWSIPLTTRIGNGYVYATRYCAPEAAEAALRRHLAIGDDVPARHLSMRVGRRAETWRGNCLSVGLAQGFIEPLEATALHIAQATVEGFIASFDGSPLEPARAAFNAAIARRYDGIRDYIVAHYRLARRADTAYWRDAARIDALSDDLRAVMTAWFTGGDLAALVNARDIARFYAPMSWAALLAGYGTFPAGLRPIAPRDDGVDDFLRRCALNFGDHDAALNRLNGRDMGERA